jgi:phosphoribosylformylglycinamidine cyclo-ligase
LGVTWGVVLIQGARMAGKLTYRQAGVDTRQAAELAGRIGRMAGQTQKRRQLHQAFGLFAAAYELKGYREPVIVSGCDGVGTKFELLMEHDMLETAGKDLVAMNVNDVLTTGGDPLMFFDYIGVPRIDEERIERLIAGMAEHLEACGCILAGGETAEMPGVVPEGVIELSGFCIGCVEKADLVDPSTVSPGDCLIGYASDGFHANGWSLVRRVLAEHPDAVAGEDWPALMAPTRLYHDVGEGLRKAGARPRAMAHITGGGLPENLARVLPEGCGADLAVPEWRAPGVEGILRHVDAEDRWHTFNMGIGWVAVVDPGDRAAALAAGPGGVELGRVIAGEGVKVHAVSDH